MMFNNSINTAVLAATLLFKSTDAINCPNARLIKAQGGPDNTCGGGTNHYWPVDYGLDACHAWQGTGTDGRLHTNSAKNMRCDGGVFKFTQYAGNLICDGTGVDKEIGTTCEQDIPPTIYTVGLDLSCCIDPDGDACKALTGQPSAREGSDIFLDGQECDADGGTTTSTPPPTPLPTPQPVTPSPTKTILTKAPTTNKPTPSGTASSCDEDTCNAIRRPMICNRSDCCVYNRRQNKCMLGSL